MSEQNQHFTPEMFEPANSESFGDKEKISRPSLTFWKDAWLRLKKNKGAIFGLFAILTIIFMAFAGPYFNSYGFDDQDIARTNLPPRIPVVENLGIFNGVDIRGVDQYEAKNVEEYFWLGTDSLGRDQWTRIWEGTQVSLYIAFLAACIDLLFGVMYGGISAFYGGKVDTVMQRIIEILIGIPNLILIILLILVLDPGILSITLALVITGWVGMSRMVRGQILKLKNQEFVLASRTLGASDRRLIGKHLIPNALGAIIVTTMFTIPSAIFFEAFLSFIGLGIRPPVASLGSLVDNGFKSLEIYPHLMIFPALVISLIMISFNLLGDGLRDAFDPKMRR